MNTRSSLLVVVALLTGCSDDDSVSDGGGTTRKVGAMDSGSTADAASTSGNADGGSVMHRQHDGAAISSQHDSGSPEQTDGEPANCPTAVRGIFSPVYTPIDGNCGPIPNPNPVPIDGGLHGVNTIIQNLAKGTITTDIVLKGCSVHMTQKVTNAAGILQSEIDAQQLTIESATRITGRISFASYDATGTLACTGNYDAVFTKAMSTVGAAH